MKKFITCVFFLCFGLLLVVVFAHGPKDKLWEKAKKIHHEAVVIDAHAHPFQGQTDTQKWELGIDCPVSQVDLVKMKQGGVDGVFYSLPLKYERGKDGMVMVSTSAKRLKSMIQKNQDKCQLVDSVQELKNTIKTGKRAIFLTTEYPDLFSGDLDKIDTYWELGLRSICLSHSKKDMLAKTDRDGYKISTGISEFGKKVINQLNRRGIMIDITHVYDQLQRDIIQTSTAPVMASHSGTRRLNRHLRGIPDDIIRALTQKGGMICVTLHSMHVVPKWRDKPPASAAIERLIDHIDHVVNLVGADHVGLGSDYGSDPKNYVKNLHTAAGWPHITYHLLKRGYSEKDIKKILGGNILRVMEEVQKYAHHN
jgi:membrane dipeptidase